MTEKKCSACHEVKPAAAFVLSLNTKSGLFSYCKDCQRLVKAANHSRLHDAHVPEERKCATCGAVLPATKFYQDLKRADGLMTECKSCNNQRGRQWYREHVKPRENTDQLFLRE